MKAASNWYLLSDVNYLHLICVFNKHIKIFLRFMTKREVFLFFLIIKLSVSIIEPIQTAV